MTPADPWAAFARDPRLPAHAALRASDLDRAAVHEVLVEAYADGRLDREEFDERSEIASQARTLGELPPLMGDLVGTRSPALRGTADLTTASPDQLRAMAVQRYASDRREAVMTFLGPSLVCWAIWAIVNWTEWDTAFPWPLFVMLGTGINLVRTLVRKPDIIESHVRRLEKKQAKALEQPLPDPQTGPDDPDEAQGRSNT